MPATRRLSPVTVYLVLRFSVSLFFSMIFTVNLIYHVTVVGLSPLQLVLVGTILEATAFAFEIPTGILADVKSRRLSIIVGTLLTGIAFVVEGSFATFGAVAVAQVIWGIGYTFTSGATEAWIADEVGEARVGRAFIQGSQAGRVGGLLAIPLSIAAGTIDVRLPIVSGGLLFLVLAGFLALAMGEEGFRPVPPGERSTWSMMAKTLGDARRLVARQPALLTLLAIGLFYGLYSEGYDRLWTAHLLGNFAAPFGGKLQPVVWIGGLRAVDAILSLAVVEGARRRLDTGHMQAVARVLKVSAALIVGGLALFGLARAFWLAVAADLMVSVLRSLVGPLQDIWINRRIDDPQVRATLFSITGQVDALGQIAGGPLVGAIGNASIRAALVTSSLLLLPVLPLYARALRSDDAARGGA